MSALLGKLQFKPWSLVSHHSILTLWEYRFIHMGILHYLHQDLLSVASVQAGFPCNIKEKIIFNKFYVLTAVCHCRAKNLDGQTSGQTAQETLNSYLASHHKTQCTHFVNLKTVNFYLFVNFRPTHSRFWWKKGEKFHKDIYIGKWTIATVYSRVPQGTILGSPPPLLGNFARVAIRSHA